MSYTRESIEYKGCTIKIVSDDDPENPRNWENASQMYCWHRRYNLGDLYKQKPISDDYNNPEDLIYELAGIDKDEYWEQHEKEPTVAELYDAIEKNGHLVAMLYLYDHSGISISSSPWTGRAQHADWDSGPVGYQVMRKETIDKEWGGDIEKARKYMEGEVETYDQYLTGDIWGFRVDGADGDSCYGYYGDAGIEDAIKEAKSSIDWHYKNKTVKHLQKLKDWIRNKVPYQYREPLAIPV